VLVIAPKSGAGKRGEKGGPNPTSPPRKSPSWGNVVRFSNPVWSEMQQIAVFGEFGAKTNNLLVPTPKHSSGTKKEAEPTHGPPRFHIAVKNNRDGLYFFFPPLISK
jgi:hypothetical protein